MPNFVCRVFSPWCHRLYADTYNLLFTHLIFQATSRALHCLFLENKTRVVFHITSNEILSELESRVI